jgi:CspA family cold shock protein
MVGASTKLPALSFMVRCGNSKRWVLSRPKRRPEGRGGFFVAVEPQSKERRALKYMAQGKVKWFNKERGYGFISPLGGSKDVFVEDFFVRNSGVADTGSRSLEEGERVAYQLTQDRWGPTAKNVCILKK